jgi:hypothetical protein
LWQSVHATLPPAADDAAIPDDQPRATAGANGERPGDAGQDDAGGGDDAVDVQNAQSTSPPPSTPPVAPGVSFREGDPRFPDVWSRTPPWAGSRRYIWE